MPIFNFIGYTLTELFRKLDNWRQIYKQTNSTCYTSNDMSKTCWEEKFLGGHNKGISLTVEVYTFAKWLFNYFLKNAEAGPEVLCKKSCSQKLCNIHRKTPMLGSLFNPENCEFFKST